jgi:hypothetical protein
MELKLGKDILFNFYPFIILFFKFGVEESTKGLMKTSILIKEDFKTGLTKFRES